MKRRVEPATITISLGDRSAEFSNDVKPEELAAYFKVLAEVPAGEEGKTG